MFGHSDDHSKKLQSTKHGIEKRMWTFTSYGRKTMGQNPEAGGRTFGLTNLFASAPTVWAAGCCPLAAAITCAWASEHRARTLRESGSATGGTMCSFFPWRPESWCMGMEITAGWVSTVAGYHRRWERRVWRSDNMMERLRASPAVPFPNPEWEKNCSLRDLGGPAILQSHPQSLQLISISSIYN